MNKFLQSYLETALWSSTGDDGEPLDKRYGIEDIAPESMLDAAEDCRRFQQDAGAMLAEGNDVRAGHDFWLTRNGHGAGFWDGDWPQFGDQLTALCKTFGERWPYVGDDGRIYL